jgi:rRNA-processing protein FCF1
MFVKRKPLRIILDSNAFFVPVYFKIDIFNELKQLLNRNFELILISPVKQELEMLAAINSNKNSKNASFALNLAAKCKYIEVKTTKGVLVDDIIVKKAKDWKAVVFTNDRELKEKLRDISVPIIYVRQKSFLAIDGMI